MLFLKSYEINHKGVKLTGQVNWVNNKPTTVFVVTCFDNIKETEFSYEFNSYELADEKYDEIVFAN